MYRPEINLFEHPTTTIFIDDSTAFLYSVTLGVDHPPFKAFSDPLAGLDYINNHANSYTHASSNGQSDTEKRSKLGSNFESLATTKLQDNLRFAEPSVVVVDYSMPQLNGLDLCSRIKNPYVKKVLLTGVAEEKVAINALNTELIDFYISKGENSLSQEINRIITHLRDRYFQDIYGWTRDVHLRPHIQTLYNSEFADYFEDICEELSIVEHYPIERPWGFIMVSKHGQLYLLTITESKQGVQNEDLKKTTDTKINNSSLPEPVTITDDESQVSYVCSVQPYTDDEIQTPAYSFAEYLAGPGAPLSFIPPHKN